MFLRKSELAKALNISRQTLWTKTLPHFRQFDKSFKTKKVISSLEAKKLLALLGFEQEEIEKVLEKID